MSESTFFRLLKTPIGDKGARLAAQIAALNETGEAEETFTLEPADFALIPGSPFAYWVGESIHQLFAKLPSVEESGLSVQHGASTKRDFRFLRLWWEVEPNTIDRNLRWFPFAKGGHYSPYHSDVHLLVNWENDAREIHDYLVERYPYLKGNTSWILHPENTYFRPGLTWPRRTGGFSVRALPTNCIFADKGPAAFVPDDEPNKLLALLAVMNSVAFETLVKVHLARTELAQSYEVGLIQHTPIPADLDKEQQHLSILTRKAHDLQRDRDRTDETTHAFCLPGLVQHREAETLLQASLALESEEQAAQARLAAIQAEIDDIVFNLYGLSESDRALVHAEMDQPQTSNLEPEMTEEEENEDEIMPPEDLPARVQNLLMWCVGVSFGRWDARMALDPTLLPPLQGPFDPLPRCAPGALVGVDGLPPSRPADIASQAWLRIRKNVLDIPPPVSEPSPCLSAPLSPFPEDGILVDDPTHPSDIVARVRQVLALLWGDRADGIEREACEVLEVKSLRDYFRDPRKGFFAFHIKRYSKSRRKAPIYWLLQSEKRNYAVWLYIHRLRPDALYAAGRDYADAKVALEQARLEELRVGLDALSGSGRRRREREIERQQKLVAEVTELRDRLDQIALLNLPPDLNDGVVIGIAPLWELTPWKEAQKMWEKLVSGEYAWSTMAQRMRERGLVKA